MRASLSRERFRGGSDVADGWQRRASKRTRAPVPAPHGRARPTTPVRTFAAGALLATGSLLAPPAAVAEPQTPEWRLSPVPEVQIGRPAGEEPYLFESIESVRLLPDGGIVVADGGALEIRVFGPTGSFRARMGGGGRGPGEFQDIGGMWLTSGGAIAAWDPASRRITTFAPNGRRLSADRVEAGGGGNLEVFFGSFSNDDVALASLRSGPRRPGRVVPNVWTVGRYSLGGGYRGALGQMLGMRRFERNPVPFTPVPFAVVRSDSLLVSDGYEALLTVWDGSGAAAATLELPLPASPPADRVWAALEAALLRRVADAPERAGPRLSLDLLARGRMPRDDRFPRVAGLLLDGEGHVWVKVYDPLVDSVWLKERAATIPAPGGVWQVLSPEQGRIVASIRIPDNLRPTEIKARRLLGVATDELGVERVVVHTLRR